MDEIRCSKCNKLLGVVRKKGKGSIEIKCPRCGELNNYNIEAP